MCVSTADNFAQAITELWKAAWKGDKDCVKWIGKRGRKIACHSPA